MKLTQYLVVAFITGFLSLGSQGLKAEEVGNLDPLIPTIGSTVVNSSIWSAAKFTTAGGSSFTLSKVTLGMDDSVGTTLDTFFVAIYADLGGTPTTLLTNGLLNGPTDPSTSGFYEYTPGIGFDVVLDPGTSYWVVVGATTVDAPSEGYFWQYPDVGAPYEGDPGWSLSNDYAYSTDEGTSFTTLTDGGSFKVKVEAASTIPEPSSYVLFFMGAGVVSWRLRRKLLSVRL